MMPTLTKVVQRVEGHRAVHFLPQEIAEAITTAEKKCMMKHKGADYVPLLFEDELHGIVTRQQINSMGGMC